MILLFWACTPAGSPEDSAGGSDSPADTAPDSSADSPSESQDDSSPACTGLELRVAGAALPSGAMLDFGGSPALADLRSVDLELFNPCAERLRFLGHPDAWITGESFVLEELPPVYLEPGEQATLRLSFAPGSVGVATGSFSLPYDQPGSPAVLELHAEATAPLRYVLAGDGAHILRSPDYGSTADYDAWETEEAHTAALIRGICAGPGRFVGVGGNAERAWWSSADGLSWESGTEAGSPLADCAWFGGQFVATDGALLWSADGRSWSRGSGSLSSHVRALAAGDRGVVAVGDAGLVAYSSTGQDWAWSGNPTTAALAVVTFGAGRFVAGGSGGTTLSSTDGQIWVVSSTGGGDVRGIVEVNGVFYLGDGQSLYRSEDGVAWDTVNATGVLPRAGLRGVLLGSSGGTLYASYDEGFSWEEGVSAAGGLGFGDGVLEQRP
jgi:hypothetical protein